MMIKIMMMMYAVRTCTLWLPCPRSDPALEIVCACSQGDNQVFTLHTDDDDEDNISLCVITIITIIMIMIFSLINSCTIDWFTDWPEDALEKVPHQNDNY